LAEPTHFAERGIITVHRFLHSRTYFWAKNVSGQKNYFTAKKKIFGKT
jgi:hypothetical protein